jgi:NADH:ubiquinone oxidoreductase subunit 3 (subunit A)
MSILISLKANNHLKIIPYECGFSSVSIPQIVFSLHFYKLILIFVVFDIEVVFILGWVLNSGKNIVIYILFFFIILVSYYIERKFRRFKWEL